MTVSSLTNLGEVISNLSFTVGEGDLKGKV